MAAGHQHRDTDSQDQHRHQSKPQPHAIATTKQGLPHDANGQLGFLQAAAVGGLSRALSAACMSPVTLVKTRMEYSGPHAVRYKNTWDALSTIARSEGPRGLFRGLAPTVLANAPFSALYYMFYTKIRHALSSEGRPQTAVNLASALAGATAATLLTQPSDVVRTRVQLGLGAAAAGGAAGAWATLRAAVRAGGLGALLTGAGPRIAKRSLQTALVWTLYEELVPALSAVWLGAVAAAQQQRQQLDGGGGSKGGGAGSSSGGKGGGGGGGGSGQV